MKFKYPYKIFSVGALGSFEKQGFRLIKKKFF